MRHKQISGLLTRAASRCRRPASLARRCAALAPASASRRPRPPLGICNHSRGRLCHIHPLPCVIVTGCWATSNSTEAATIAGVDAVITHHQDVAAELDRLLAAWKSQESPFDNAVNSFPEQKPIVGDNVSGWSNNSEASSASPATYSKSAQPGSVNENATNLTLGTRHLPLLGQHQTGRQRAVMKIQDGCDASCTYCIIPRMRPAPWSKSVEDAVTEASALVAAGHVEIVLTGIFLVHTAIRRRCVAGRFPTAPSRPWRD